MQWRAQGALMPQEGGLYVVEDDQGEPLYAGQSDDLRGRFDGRSAALHELSVTEADLPIQVRIATVSSAEPSWPWERIALAERWLVRALRRRDQRNMLQNINLTWPFQAPADGLTIGVQPALAPDYVEDSPGYHSLGDGWWGYTYAGNSTVLGP